MLQVQAVLPLMLHYTPHILHSGTNYWCWKYQKRIFRTMVGLDVKELKIRYLFHLNSASPYHSSSNDVWSLWILRINPQYYWSSKKNIDYRISSSTRATETLLSLSLGTRASKRRFSVCRRQKFSRIVFLVFVSARKLAYKLGEQAGDCYQMYMLYDCYRNTGPTKTAIACHHRKYCTTFLQAQHQHPANLKQPSQVSFICFMVLVLSRMFHIKPSSLTSHMVNLPRGWYPHAHSVFASLVQAVVICFTLVCFFHFFFQRLEMKVRRSCS